jgi:hypothetical protein
MKKIWIILTGIVVIGLIAINLNMRVTTSETSPLVLRNIEALAGDESGEDPFPCTVAGGMCYYLGEPYFGISLI